MPKIFLDLRKVAIPLAMFAVVALGSVAVARADSVTIIDKPNAGLAGSPPPYATVSLTLVTVNQGATLCSAAAPCINVSVAMNGGYQLFGNGGGNGAFGFNVVGASDGTGLFITNLTSGFSADLTGGNFDGWGNFDVGIQGPPASGAQSALSFTVSRAGGFSTTNTLFEANSTGAHFVVHVAPTNGNPTGFAADLGTPTVPEPTSMLLLGTGLIGLAVGVRRRLRK